MNVLNNLMKRRGAGDPPNPSVTAYETQRNDINLLVCLQAIRDLAWGYAVKYRFDPVLGQTHEEYLDLLNEVIRSVQDE